MPDALVIDCTKQQESTRPLTQAEQDQRTADATAAQQDASVQATRSGNADTLRTRAQGALTANATYLGLAAPTTAQNTTQLQRVTKECSALIRLLLSQLDDISGT